MSITSQSLKQPFPVQRDIDSTKLKNLGKVYNDLKEIALKEDGQALIKEAIQLKNLSTSVLNTNAKINAQRTKCLETKKNLEKQVNQLSQNISQYQKLISDDTSEVSAKAAIEKLQKQYYERSVKRISLASNIDIKKLKKLDLDDRKSPAQQPFKWILVSIYGQPESKYYWPNFNQQVFCNDQGIDLKQRLGKVNATKILQQQKLKTQYFLNNYDNIASSSQLQTVKDELNIIKLIAVQFQGCYEIGKKIEAIQQQTLKRKQKNIERDGQYSRWKARSDALGDRIKLNDGYLSILDKYSSSLVDKQAKYKQKVLKIEQTVKKLAQSSKWKPIINVGQQVGSGCGCMF